ncbi:DciA family protein [Chamaesiphon sp.]|uniref:DciA family protein n=1 Tax=Chamaesiphon sp. TaxID=2814140 RepID=UPI0035948650
MSLTSIAAIACQLQTQPGWEGVRDWGLIVTAWKATVSPTIAERSQPRSIARGILKIATNSSSLAHQLTFGRQALCQQLNTHLVTPIDELRFVAVGYNSSQSSTQTAIAIESIPIDSGEIVICSHCHCRARQGELLRWRVCKFCAIDLGIIGGKLRIKS